MQEIKLLHISSALSWRGGEQQIAYLVEALNKLNIEQHLFCVEQTPMEAWCKTNKISHFAYKKRSSFSTKTAEKVAAFCYIKKINIVHAHDSHAHTYAFMSVVLNWNKANIVVSRRVDFPIRSNLLSKWKYNHNSIKKIICVSEGVKSVLFPVIKDKEILNVIYDGIDIERFVFDRSNILHREFNLPKEKIIIANIAAIANHKDYFTFVNTARCLINRGLDAIFFIIGGDGGEEAMIKKYVHQQNLSAHILFTGFRTDIPRILPEVDVLLFTSKEEGLGTTILDAFACRVTVVATAAGGIPEIVLHEQTGLLANIGDANTLADYVEKILKNNDLRLQLIRNATQKVMDFSKENMAKKTLEVYQYLL
jgi:glycosyltransferase involved in cell wall biosynthesis